MPIEVDKMLDWKTLFIVGLLGGTNALQYLGFSAPAQNTTAETQAAAEILGDELKACYERADRLADQLQECRELCR
jgi:hypothetical protein